MNAISNTDSSYANDSAWQTLVRCRRAVTSRDVSPEYAFEIVNLDPPQAVMNMMLTNEVTDRARLLLLTK